MSAARTVEAAREIAADLGRIEGQLAVLLGDAEKHNLHRATERIHRMMDCAHTTAHGLRIQATKIEGNLA